MQYVQTTRALCKYRWILDRTTDVLVRTTESRWIQKDILCKNLRKAMISNDKKMDDNDDYDDSKETILKINIIIWPYLYN